MSLGDELCIHIPKAHPVRLHRLPGDQSPSLRVAMLEPDSLKASTCSNQQQPMAIIISSQLASMASPDEVLGEVAEQTFGAAWVLAANDLLSISLNKRILGSPANRTNLSRTTHPLLLSILTTQQRGRVVCECVRM